MKQIVKGLLIIAGVTAAATPNARAIPTIDQLKLKCQIRAVCDNCPDGGFAYVRVGQPFSLNLTIQKGQALNFIGHTGQINLAAPLTEVESAGYATYELPVCRTPGDPKCTFSGFSLPAPGTAYLKFLARDYGGKRISAACGIIINSVEEPPATSFPLLDETACYIYGPSQVAVNEPFNVSYVVGPYNPRTYVYAFRGWQGAEVTGTLPAFRQNNGRQFRPIQIFGPDELASCRKLGEPGCTFTNVKLSRPGRAVLYLDAYGGLTFRRDTKKHTCKYEVFAR